MVNDIFFVIMTVGDKMKKLLIALLAALYLFLPFQKVNALPEDKIVVHYFYSDT